MSKSAKYTSNFVDRSKPGMYSDAVAPEFTAEDAGKTFAVGEDGNISLSDPPIVFHVEVDGSDNAVIVEDPEIIKAAYGKPASIQVPVGENTAILPVAWVSNSTAYPTITAITAQHVDNALVVIFGYANMSAILNKYTVTVKNIGNNERK